MNNFQHFSVKGKENRMELLKTALETTFLIMEVLRLMLTTS